MTDTDAFCEAMRRSDEQRAAVALIPPHQFGRAVTPHEAYMAKLINAGIIETRSRL